MKNEMLVPFETDYLGLLRGSLGNGTLSLPFAQEIFLLETQVAGTSYVDHIEDLEKDLHRQDHITSPP